MLTPREEKILRMRFGIEKIGAHAGRGRERLLGDAGAHPPNRGEGQMPR